MLSDISEEGNIIISQQYFYIEKVFFVWRNGALKNCLNETESYVYEQKDDIFNFFVRRHGDSTMCNLKK